MARTTRCTKCTQLSALTSRGFGPTTPIPVEAFAPQYSFSRSFRSTALSFSKSCSLSALPSSKGFSPAALVQQRHQPHSTYVTEPAAPQHSPAEASAPIPSGPLLRMALEVQLKQDACALSSSSSVPYRLRKLDLRFWV
eukprot:988857-Pelagomonas_calceolata.AAC.3